MNFPDAPGVKLFESVPIKFTSFQLSDVRFTCTEYFETFINFSFAFLLVPFRVQRLNNGSNQSLIIRESSVQRGLCKGLHATLLLFSLLSIRPSYFGRITERPQVLIIFWDKINTTFLQFVFFYTFWTKKNEILKVISAAAKHSGTLQDWKQRFMILFVVISEIYVFVSYAFFGKKRSWITAFEEYVGRPMFTFFLQGTNSPIPYESMTWIEMVITIAYMLLDLYSGIVIRLSCAFVYISSLVIGNAAKISLQSLQQLRVDWDTAVSNFDRLYKFVEDINDFNGLLMLAVYMESIPFFSLFLVQSWDTGHWQIRFGSFFIMTFYLIPFVVAAEATHQVGLLKQWILKMEGQSENRSIISQWISESDIGVEGARFFIVGYGFLGNSCSILLTYAIIMIQFELQTLMEAEAT